MMIRKKDIMVVCFVLLITILSLWAIWKTSSNAAINKINNSKTEDNNQEVIPQQANNTKGPTIINNTMDTTKDIIKQNNGTQSSSNALNGEVSKNTDSSIGANNSKPLEVKTSNTTAPLAAEVFITYELKKGDTLSSLCKQYAEVCPPQIMTKAILDINKLTNTSDVKEGMKIKIPSKYTSNGIKYTIKKGDTLYDIVIANFKNNDLYSTIEQITKDNFLKDSNIFIGEELFLSKVNKTKPVTNSPDEQQSSTTINNTTSKIPSNNDYISYTVKKGDTLTSICKQYEKYCPVPVSTKTILNQNKLSDAKEIKEGIILKIPEKYLTNGQNYTIKAGDTLSQISKTLLKDLDIFKGSDKIKKDNFLSSYNIIIGQQLFITASSLEAKN